MLPFPRPLVLSSEVTPKMQGALAMPHISM